jgi:hypothetical protein
MGMALTPSMQTTIQNMGFGGILQLAKKSLDNWEFMSWLMDRFDPENMSIEVGEGKQISLTEHSVKCISELSSKGRDPPPVTGDTGKKLLTSVIARLLPDEPSPKDVKVNPTRAAEMIEMYNRLVQLVQRCQRGIIGARLNMRTQEKQVANGGSLDNSASQSQLFKDV